MRLDRVTLALLSVQLLFAVHYVAAKWLLTLIPPPAWVALRVTGAAVVLVLVTRSRWKDWPRDRGTWLKLAVLAVFGVVLNQILFLEGLSRTVPSHSALINTSIPVTTLLVAVLLRQERLTARKALAVALSLSGVLFLMGLDRTDLAGGTLLGDILCLVNATSFSVYLVLSKPVVARLGARVTTPTTFLLGSLAVLAYGAPSLSTHDWSQVPWTAYALGAAIIAGPTVGAYMLNLWALRRVDSSRVALFVYLQFLLAAPLSAWLLRETLSWRLIPAAVLVFAGVALSSTGKGKGPPTYVGSPPRDIRSEARTSSGT